MLPDPWVFRPVRYFSKGTLPDAFAVLLRYVCFVVQQQQCLYNSKTRQDKHLDASALHIFL